MNSAKRKREVSIFLWDNNFFRCRFTREMSEEEEQPLAVGSFIGSRRISSGECLRCFFHSNDHGFFLYLRRGFLIGNLLIWFTREWAREEKATEFVCFTRFYSASELKHLQWAFVRWAHAWIIWALSSVKNISRSLDCWCCPTVI